MSEIHFRCSKKLCVYKQNITTTTASVTITVLIEIHRKNVVFLFRSLISHHPHSLCLFGFINTFFGFYFVWYRKSCNVVLNEHNIFGILFCFNFGCLFVIEKLTMQLLSHCVCVRHGNYLHYCRDEALVNTFSRKQNENKNELTKKRLLFFLFSNSSSTNRVNVLLFVENFAEMCKHCTRWIVFWRLSSQKKPENRSNRV